MILRERFVFTDYKHNLVFYEVRHNKANPTRTSVPILSMRLVYEC